MRNKPQHPSDLPLWLSIVGLLAVSTIWTAWVLFEMRT